MNKNRIKKLADHAVREGTEHTTDDGLFLTTSCTTASVRKSPTPMKTESCSKKYYGREKKSTS